MIEKRFGYGETDLFEWVEDNGKMISTKECVNKLNEQQSIIEALKEKLCELGVSDVKINGKRIDTGLEEWLDE